LGERRALLHERHLPGVTTLEYVITVLVTVAATTPGEGVSCVCHARARAVRRRAGAL